MGRVTNQTPVTAPSPINHFSHPHQLHPLLPHQVGSASVCSGCKLQLTGITYICVPCNFNLHQSCAKLPKNITHACHSTCVLTLRPVSSYPGGFFSCDACARRSDGWSYHCTRCEYDLHVTCASKPLKIKHQAHISCQLELTFKDPYPNAKGFSCDICRKIGSKQWLYRCHTCEFDVHLDCTNAANFNPQSALQHHNSFPDVASHQHPHQLMHSASTVTNQQFQGTANRPGQVYGYGAGNQPMGGGLGSNLMAAAAQGFVEGAFQGIGQAVVQDFISGGDGGSGVDGDGGEGASF